MRAKCDNRQQALGLCHPGDTPTCPVGHTVRAQQFTSKAGTMVALTCPSGRPGSAQWTPADWWARAPRCTLGPTPPLTSPALHPRSAAGGGKGIFRAEGGGKHPKGCETPGWGSSRAHWPGSASAAQGSVHISVRSLTQRVGRGRWAESSEQPGPKVVLRTPALPLTCR